MNKKRILLKLTGGAFKTKQILESVAQQIKALGDQYQFGIVVGGGNFFRGDDQGKKLTLSRSVGHHVGMLATMMNGMILQDMLEKQGIETALFSAVVCPGLITPARESAINRALQKGLTVIFSGGTGLPFFTTDTNAVVRALQINAEQLWKATDVEGVYEQDPDKNPQAKLIKTMSHAQALAQNIKVMDETAFSLAAKENLPIRVFSIFSENSLVQAADDKSFGSTIQN